MKKWNFVTFDEISGRVTSQATSVSASLSQALRDATARSAASVAIVGALVLANPTTAQIQPGVTGTPITCTVSVGSLDITENARPPFFEELGGFLNSSFVSSHAEALCAIAGAGSSRNLLASREQVISAFANSEDDETWKPTI